jgi:ATP-dependent helicase Lhr and Lhr-like helicase
MGRTGRRSGTTRNCLFLATDDEELLADLAIALLWREGAIDPITPPTLPAHVYAQQVMALTLQEGGITRPELDAWLADAAEAVPADARDTVIRHMLTTNILSEDAGIIGFGTRGEREFGRRHFSDLVAAFSSPWLLTVRHGVLELGSVHPASIARVPSETSPTLLLGGRSWKVVNVDWPRRCVSVTPVEGGGKSRWLGIGRMLPFSICRAQERVITGVEPPCQVSRRAVNRLATIRVRFEFIDGQSLPLVSDGIDRVTVWLFSGGLVSASVARALSNYGLPVTGWDGVSVTVRVNDLEWVSRSLKDLNVTAAYPALRGDLETALKFSLCLPPQLTEAVIIARTFRPEEVACSLSRGHRRVIRGSV